MTEEELRRVFDGELSFEEQFQENERITYSPSYDLSPNFAGRSWCCYGRI